MQIVLNDCSISIHQQLILENISISLKKGKVYQISGANGSGKTVLMNTLLGLHTNIKGDYSIEFDQKELCYIPENLFFFDDESVAIIIKTITFFYHEKLSSIIQILDYLDFDYKTLKNKKAFELSQGMRKKLMIIPIFLERMKVFFLDEIFTGLDINTQNILIHRLHALIKAEKTIIFIEHNESIIKRLWHTQTELEVFLCQGNKVKQFIKKNY